MDRTTAIKTTGYVKCGVSGNKPHYSEIDSESIVPSSSLAKTDQHLTLYQHATGIEADLCRAVATGMFGTQNALVYFSRIKNIELGTQALNDESVDLFFRDIPYWHGVQYTNALELTQPLYFEIVTLLMSKGYANSVDDLSRYENVCYRSTTKVGKSLKAWVESTNRKWVLKSVDQSELRDIRVLLASKCDVLALRHSSTLAIASFQELEEDYNEFPLYEAAPIPIVAAYPLHQTQWKRIVEESLWSPLKAEVKGVDSKVQSTSFNSWIWTNIGLDKPYGSDIVRAVGNFGEIYERNLGAVLANRGPNQHFSLHKEGLFVPPF